MNKKQELIISAFTIILIIILLICMIIGKMRIENYTIDKTENFYFYIDQEYMEFEGEATLNRDKKVTNLVMNEIKLENVVEPIYYKNKKKVIFPNSMSIIRPTLGMKQDRINYYTTIEYKNPVNKISNVNLDMDIANAFVYDGVNTYFFIDDVELEFGKEKIKLPSFSYVRCDYKNYLYVYNYETKEMNYYEKVDDIVYAKTNNYTINLSTDNLSVGDNSIILVKNIEKLNNLK